MKEETTLLPDYINASDPDHKSVDEECRFRNVAQVKARTREEEQEIVGGNNGSVEPEKNAPGKEHDVRHEVPPNEEASEDYQYHPSCENAEGDIQNLTGRTKEPFALRLKVTDTEQEQYSLASEASESTTTSLHSNGAWRQVDSMARQFVGNNASDHCKEVSKMEPFSRDLQAVKCIFRQDVVRSNKTGAIGIVTEVAGDSDSDGSISADEDDEDDEDEDEDVGDEQGDGVANTNVSESNDKNNGQREYKCADLQEDQVRVIWLGPTEPVHSVKDLTVLDREFLHGDYVASASDPTGQIGVVVDVNISVDLLAQDDSYTIKDVSTKEIKRVREFAVGDYVVLGPWLGRVDDVFDNVTVLFDDGSVCKVVRAEPTRLRPFLPFEDNGHVPYHPGQRVRASSSSVFKNSRWLSGLWKANRLEGTVTKVTPGSVFVYWIASSGYGPDSSTSPAEEQNPKNLKLLSCFVHANWQVFDWCLLPSSSQSSSIALDKDISKSRSGDTIKSKRKYGRLGSGTSSKEVNLDESNEAFELLHVDTKHVPGEGNKKAKASPESSTCSSSLFVSKEPVHEPWPLHRKKIRKVVIRKDKKLRKKEENYEKALLIVNSKTKVDVAWQDGTIECGIESTALIPIDTPGDQEFVAEQYVVEKSSDDVGDAHEPRHVGVVRSVNAKERTASIRWLKPVARAEDPREFDREEIVSVYEIEGHPDYDYCYGDVVVRLCPVSSPKESASGGVPIEDLMQQSGPAQPEQDPKHCGGQDVEDASGNGDSMAFDDPSWVGNITGLKNGDIEVTWADGMVSMVGPQAIYVVGRDDDESVVGGSEVGDDAASWETVDDDDDDDGDDDDDIDQMETHDTTQQELGRGTNSGTGESLENNTVRNAAMSLSLAALDFMTRLASGLFSGRRKNVDVADKDHEVKCQGILDNSDEKSSQGQSSSNKFGVVDDYIGESMDETGKEQVSASAHEFSVSAKSSSEVGAEESEHGTYTVDSIWSFKRFDIAKDPVDHYFLGASGQDSNGRKWLKKVQQDWNILQNNLPEGIYVRVYEDRMDLLRAVIIGAYGTPYQDGLFFFDFHLPPEYPDVPPSAYYHSGGWRINPNLYEEGKVCLSLLNTWTGRGNEVWDPISSSILQVLVSLQGLVLNSKPYFNEAGYDKQVGTAEGEKNSLAYNENTFLLNCKTMMYLMRKPPKDFEDLIRQHFKRRGYYVLKACNTYMKGYLIGSLAEDASVGDHETANFTSVGFKLMLGKIMPKLILALNEVGADCHEFEHRQQSS